MSELIWYLISTEFSVSSLLYDSLDIESSESLNYKLTSLKIKAV